MAKTILITGASTGIGAATARRFAAGNRVIIHYHSSSSEANAVAAAVQRTGGTAHVVQANLATDAGCRELASFAAETCGQLDVLVNNSGGLVRRCPARQLEWHLMQEVFALNAFSTMMLSSLCIPLLERGEHPCIVNVTSIAVRHGAPSATIYGAAKGALDTFTRGLAKELAPTIRVNAVAPGVIDTPFHARVTTPEKMAEFKASTPVRRIGQPEEIAEAIAFLADSLFMTGETVDVNGGLFMR
ncbi:MAG: SDR family oxidoreductase [Candidatus Anammoximicrobium sp.]|nr:SDR family oxidoreductase [Candidatus Anammoximicrobium sp.]